MYEHLPLQVQDMLSKAQARYEEGDRYQALKLWEQALKQVQAPAAWLQEAQLQLRCVSSTCWGIYLLGTPSSVWLRSG